MTDPFTKAKQAEVKKERARKFGEKSKASKLERIERKKRAKDFHAEDVLSLAEIDGDFHSMLELTVIDRLQAHREASM